MKPWDEGTDRFGLRDRYAVRAARLSARYGGRDLRTRFGVLQLTRDSIRLAEWSQWAKTVPTKRALLSYLPGPVLDSAVGAAPVAYSNHGIARDTVRVLNEAGYSVDVVKWDDTDSKVYGDYDLWVQHGGANYAQLKGAGVQAERLVYFSTGNYWRFHNAAALARETAFQARNGVLVPAERMIEYAEDAVLSDADAVAALGNEFTRSYYPATTNVRLLPNASYAAQHLDSSVTNSPSRSGSFLFFAGSGSLHKGLDLVLEAWEGRRENLYVVCQVSPAIADYYRGLLSRTGSVHLLGFIPVHSRRFEKLARSCTFSILPSCSEAQPGSVVETMARGCLPLVSDACGLDVKGFGLSVSQPEVGTVSAAVDLANSWSASELVSRREELGRCVRERHTPMAFRSAAREALFGSEDIPQDTSAGGIPTLPHL